MVEYVIGCLCNMIFCCSRGADDEKMKIIQAARKGNFTFHGDEDYSYYGYYPGKDAFLFQDRDVVSAWESEKQKKISEEK